MREELRVLVAGLILFFLGFSQTVQASHILGSELTYYCVAPGVYVADLKVYRECFGAGIPVYQLNIKSLNCNAGRNIPFTKVGTNQLGSHYCPAVPVSCTSSGFENFEAVNYTATVVFSAAEQACPEWPFSFTECCRQNLANLQNASGLNHYAEAMVRLSATINNNSPQFGDLVTAFVNYNQPIQLSSYALDLDGDSLVYSLQAPWSGHNMPVPFNSYPATQVFNADATKSAMLPAGTFSPAFPLLSANVDWSQPIPGPATPKFDLDHKTGSMAFVPVKYVANSPAQSGENRYVLVVQVDEYRKVGATTLKVGSVRRDMFFTILHTGNNQNPKIIAPVANGQVLSQTDIINLRPGTPLNFQVSTTDGNSGDILTLSTNVTAVFPGATFSSTAASQPTATISWTPAVSDIRSQVYYFQVWVTDNACPLKGAQIYTFGVKVSVTGGVTGTTEPVKNAGFLAYPNPFSSELQFTFNLQHKAESILIYNLLGQEIDKILLKKEASGQHYLPWKNAGKFGSGTYVAKLVSQGKILETVKFTKLQ